MSGKDERPNADIPICPECGSMPDFWILSVNSFKWFWLHSEDYLDQHPLFKKVTSYRCNPVELEDVHTIKCEHSIIGPSRYHSFCKDDSEFIEVFRTIIKQAKYYIDCGECEEFER